jgi:stage II sporulation protein E
LQLSRRDWTRKLEEGRVIAGDYVKNIARVLDRLADDASAPESSRPAVPVLRIESGIAKLPKRGGHISGDSFAAAPLGDGRYLMALSDGMGVGRGAALESKHCVNLLHKMLEAGFSVDVAVNTVNSVLLLRSPDETFATVDLCVADLTTGRAEFVKVGAAPSFCKRGSDVTVIKVASVPVGIINQVQVEPEFRVLRPGDIIVMITDGIWDVSTEEVDKERWIVNHLARETSSQPSEIAESLLAKALEVMPQSGDDMTVLVARIDLVGSQFDPIPQRTARPTSSWAVARTAPRTKAKASGAHDS